MKKATRSLRYSSDKGYQTRINGLLRTAMTNGGVLGVIGV
jgi:uncharacterized protein (DUF4415 family)